MTIKLSHTQKEMYLSCSEKWRLHYQERLRSTKIGSALFFGSAIDDACNRLLLEKKSVLTEEETKLMGKTAHEILEESLREVRVLDETRDISQDRCAQYYKSDLDLDLLSAHDITEVLEFADSRDIVLTSYEDLTVFCEQAQELMKRGLDDETQRVYNYTCWLSLLRKGELLVDTYEQIIMTQIEEVYEVQKKINLEDDGDEFIGYIDVICSFLDEPGVQYVCDNKTSSKAYKPDSVRISSQLAAYAEYEGNYKCAYIVLEKKLRKREPRVRVNTIKDTVDQETVDDTFDDITKVLNGIKENKFEKNFDSCFQYGQKCAYYMHCRTGDLKDLQYLPKREKIDDKEENISKDQRPTSGGK